MAIPFIPLLIIWILFSKYTFLSKSSTIGRFFSLVGRRSLDVYFIHYFFLPNLHVWGDYFEMMNIPLIEYLFALTLSIPIIYVSLGIGCVLRLSPLTTSFLLGGKPTRYAGRRIVAGKPQK